MSSRAAGLLSPVAGMSPSVTCRGSRGTRSVRRVVRRGRDAPDVGCRSAGRPCGRCRPRPYRESPGLVALRRWAASGRRRRPRGPRRRWPADRADPWVPASVLASRWSQGRPGGVRSRWSRFLDQGGCESQVPRRPTMMPMIEAPLRCWSAAARRVDEFPHRRSESRKGTQQPSAFRRTVLRWSVDRHRSGVTTRRHRKVSPVTLQELLDKQDSYDAPAG